LEIVVDMPEVDAVVVQSSSDAWITVKKSKIEELLNIYKTNK